MRNAGTTLDLMFRNTPLVNGSNWFKYINDPHEGNILVSINTLFF